MFGTPRQTIRDEDEIVSGVVLAEIIGYIRETYRTEGVPVFKVSHFAPLLRDRLEQYGEFKSLTENVHSARLEDNILRPCGVQERETHASRF